MRHCMAVRSWASSTITCPNVQGLLVVGRRLGAAPGTVGAVTLEHLLRAHGRGNAELVDRAARLVEAASLRRRRRARARPGGPRMASASSTSGRSASVQATVPTSGTRSRNKSRSSSRGAVRGGVDQRREAQEIVHQLRAREHRPHPLERGGSSVRRSRWLSSCSHSAGGRSPRECGSHRHLTAVLQVAPGAAGDRRRAAGARGTRR